MTQPTTEDDLIKSIASDLRRWCGGGFNTDFLDQQAEERAIRIISKVRRAIRGQSDDR